jgi:hypothetical protein
MIRNSEYKARSDQNHSKLNDLELRPRSNKIQPRTEKTVNAE